MDGDDLSGCTEVLLVVSETTVSGGEVCFGGDVETWGRWAEPPKHISTAHSRVKTAEP